MTSLWRRCLQCWVACVCAAGVAGLQILLIGPSLHAYFPLPCMVRVLTGCAGVLIVWSTGEGALQFLDSFISLLWKLMQPSMGH